MFDATVLHPELRTAVGTKPMPTGSIAGRLAQRLPIAAAVTGAMLSLGIAPASAHPHVWVELATTIVYERGTFTGIRQTWVFDELYTTQALDGLPAAKDGTFGRTELAELTKANMDGLKEYNFFTSATLAGTALKLAEPVDAYLEHVPVAAIPGPLAQPPATTAAKPAAKPAEIAPAGGFWSRVWASLMGTPPKPAVAVDSGPKVLTLTFTLPLAQPVMADAAGFEVLVADPSLFIWFEPAKANAVAMSADAPAACVARFKPADASQAEDQKRLGDAFSTAMGTAGTVATGARAIVAKCG